MASEKDQEQLWRTWRRDLVICWVVRRVDSSIVGAA
jgi:hypothetical protein